jgi:tRNA(Ile)-lysidine synthase TilS/MesJ
VKGEAALEEFVAPYRSASGQPDCIVGFSGGRDSTYALYYVKNILRMNPIAFTFDWGMLYRSVAGETNLKYAVTWASRTFLYQQISSKKEKIFNVIFLPG